jgi:hypothetical protein
MGAGEYDTHSQRNIQINKFRQCATAALLVFSKVSKPFLPGLMRGPDLQRIPFPPTNFHTRSNIVCHAHFLELLISQTTQQADAPLDAAFNSF